MAGLEIKQKKELHLLGWFFWLAVLGLIIAGLWFGYRWYMTGEEPPIPIPIASANPQVDESDVSEQQRDKHEVPADHPRYISIPKLSVDKARVFEVGLTKDGQLDVPKNINDTAWYRDSSTPGSGQGAVLIDGHNGGFNKDGVFAKLSSLQAGDRITIERGDGEEFTYEVVENKSLSLEEANKKGMQELMYSPKDGTEGLSLITCDGNWVPRLQQFDRRIMLRAALVD